MKIMKIANNTLEFHAHGGKLGISLSGGADSAILLYLIMKYCDAQIVAYTCNSNLKNRRNGLYASSVINKCIDLTGNNNIEHNIFYVEEQTEDNLIKHLNKKIIDDKLDFMYTAITAVPPVEVTDKFRDQNIVVIERDPTQIKNVYNGLRQQFYSPFVNINKRIIKTIYDEEQVTTKLWPLTRSCESLTKLSGHCGQCWWCEERNWAFNNIEIS